MVGENSYSAHSFEKLSEAEERSFRQASGGLVSVACFRSEELIDWILKDSLLVPITRLADQAQFPPARCFAPPGNRNWYAVADLPRLCKCRHAGIRAGAARRALAAISSRECSKRDNRHALVFIFRELLFSVTRGNAGCSSSVLPENLA